MDLDKLVEALDNEENSKFIDLTTKKIQKIKQDILTELEIPKIKIKEMMKKLKEYMYIDDMSELRYGSYIKWIYIKEDKNEDENEDENEDDADNDLYLTSGGILCDIKIVDSGIHLCCKNFAHKHFQLKMEENLIFQKLTSQEQVLLLALDQISK